MKTAGSWKLPMPDSAADKCLDKSTDASAGRTIGIFRDLSMPAEERYKGHEENAEDYPLRRCRKIFPETGAKSDCDANWQRHPPRPCPLPGSNPHLQAAPQTPIETTRTVRPDALIRVRKTTPQSRRTI